MEVRKRGTATGLRALSWSRTVPRELVHRVSVAEVLLTDVIRIDDASFAAAACWPRSHPTFPLGGPPVHHPLMPVETLRQLGIFIPLRYFGVPADARLVISDLFVNNVPEAQPLAHHGATEVTCQVRVTGLRTDSKGAASSLRLYTRFLAEGIPFAEAGGGVRFLSPDRYAALRGATCGPRRQQAQTVRPDPVTLGVPHHRDVLVGVAAGLPDGARSASHDPLPGNGSPGRGECDVVLDAADARHPFFFDHPSDHVPGVVLLEAARQAAALASGGKLLRPTGVRLTAVRFTEFAPAARIICVAHHRTCVFRFEQSGRRPAFGVLRYSSPPRV